jgi:hypothetical protein
VRRQNSPRYQGAYPTLDAPGSTLTSSDSLVGVLVFPAPSALVLTHPRRLAYTSVHYQGPDTRLMTRRAPTTLGYQGDAGPYPSLYVRPP